MNADTGERINVDFDRLTGAHLAGWAAVEQNIMEGLFTDFGLRVMREYFGSLMPRALGRPINPRASLGLISSIAAYLDVFEPRFSVVQITPLTVTRDGRLSLEISGEYMPRALLGDTASVGNRKILADLLSG